MTVNVAELQFYSGFPIDKIVYTVTTPTYTVPASSGGFIPGTILETISNPYGSKCYTTVSYTTDGTNYYDQNAEQNNSSFGVSVGCDNSNIYIYAQNYNASTINVTLNITLDTID